MKVPSGSQVWLDNSPNGSNSNTFCNKLRSVFDHVHCGKLGRLTCWLVAAVVKLVPRLEHQLFGDIPSLFSTLIRFCFTKAENCLAMFEQQLRTSFIFSNFLKNFFPYQGFVDRKQKLIRIIPVMLNCQNIFFIKK
ncbi:hypothetical protein BpHYR1_023580 [Brachionus plicatilis]|uniref:Uncharacterized protein n=1 Tax=Brachionus plicatilis TaxID=10195 RepID=A0A3M7TCC8_BRAPC|nr:hypothetical protein BpHYR1_023580 [Brachionus plicatilis]